MGTRSPDEVKRELESERERLGTAVGTLRTQAGTVRRRLPLVALAATGLGLAVRTIRRHVLRRFAPASEKRGRFSFRDRS